MQRGFGRLEATIVAQGQALHRRQDDMRREVLGVVTRLERRWERQEGGKDWLERLPWRWIALRLLIGLYALLGALGLIKPAWDKWLRLLFGM